MQVNPVTKKPAFRGLFDRQQPLTLLFFLTCDGS